MNDIQRGEHAKRLLGDPILTEALDDIENSTIEMWRNTNDSKARNELWFTLKGLERFKHQLQIAIAHGEFETIKKD